VEGAAGRLEREERGRALAAAREARRLGRLRTAVEALDRAVALLGPGDASDDAPSIAAEGVQLGRALEAKGAPLAALSEFLRAHDLDPSSSDARDGIERGVRAYGSWRPPLKALAPGGRLRAGATGAFWIARDVRARSLVWAGGIASESLEPARTTLVRASLAVAWLLLDMKELGHTSSPGLALAVKAAQELESRGGGLVLFAVAPNLALVIETLGLAKHLKMAPDIAAAVGVARPRGSRVS
jgi:anti-anti-sigma regulatory factor